MEVSMTTIEKSEFRVAGVVWFLFLFALLLGLFAPVKVSAQTPSAPAPTSVVFNTALRRAYIGLQGGTYHPDMVQQGDLTVTLPSGIFFSVWGSTDLTDKKNFGKELDIIVGHTFEKGPFSLTSDVQYFVLRGGDALNTNLRVGLGALFIKGEVYIPAGWLDKSPSIKEGWAVSGGFAKDFSRGPFSFSFEESVRYDSGAFGYESAWVLSGYAGLSLEMNAKTTFFTGVRLTQPITNVTDRSRFVNWEIGISRTLR